MSGPRRSLRDDLVVFDAPGVGRTLAVLPVIPEAAPYRVREGIARRRLVAIEGRCPCGVVFDRAAAARGEVGAIEILHERRCPADTRALQKAIRRWVR